MSRFLLIFSILLIILSFPQTSSGQVAIGTGATAPTPNPNAVLLLVGNGNNQGLIIPSASSLSGFGSAGMVVYNSSSNTVHFHNGTAWTQVGAGGSGIQGIQISGNTVSLTATPNAGFGLASPTPTVTGQLLVWNGTGWESTPAPTTTGQTLSWNQTSGKWTVSVPSASTTTLSGDVSGPVNATTISTSAGGSIVSALNNGSTTTKILESRLSPSATNNQVLTTIGGVAQWSSQAVTSLPTLSANQLFSNNGANTGIAVGGDLGLSVTGTTGTFTIGNNAITNAKINNGAVTTTKIGTAGVADANKALTTDASGNPQWTALSAGGVTSVGLALPSIFTVSGSPITTSGTLTGNLATQAANTFLAGPAASVGLPTFRSLVSADIPALTAAQIPALDASKITTGTFTALQIPNLDASKITTGTFTAAQIPSLDASKITTGSLPLTLGGTGGTSAATARTSLGLGSLATLSAVDLSGALVTNTLPVARGGTNAIVTPIAGGISYGTGSAYAFTAVGTSGQLLQSTGAAAPTWVSVIPSTAPSNRVIKGNAGGTAQVASLIGDDGISINIINPSTNSYMTRVWNQNGGGSGLGFLTGTVGASIVASDDTQSQVFALQAQAGGINASAQMGGVMAAANGISGWNRGLVASAANSATLNTAIDAFANSSSAGTNNGLVSTIGNGATNYGLTIFASGTGTKYGVYVNGEDTNYFSGNVGIGTNSIFVNSRLTISDGHIQTRQTTNPTISVNTSFYAGTASITPNSTDVAGQFTFSITTSSCGGCNIVDITFNKAYQSPPIVIITPASVWAAIRQNDFQFFITTSVNGFQVRSNAGPANSNPCTFNYFVIDAQ